MIEMVMVMMVKCGDDDIVFVVVVVVDGTKLKRTMGKNMQKRNDANGIYVKSNNKNTKQTHLFWFDNFITSANVQCI